MSGFECGSRQLPIQRDGYVEMYDSTSFQLAREMGAWERPVSPRKLQEALRRRQSEQDECERRRKAQAVRWQAVADGLMAPCTVSESLALHPDTADSRGGGGFGARSMQRREQRAAAERKAEAESLDRLLDAVLETRELEGVES